MTDIKWPEGAEAKIDGDYMKWADGVEYHLENGDWLAALNSWSLDRYCKSSTGFKIIERPIETVEINWDEQPTPEYVAITYNARSIPDVIWCVECVEGWENRDMLFYSDDPSFTVHHKPADTPYVPKLGDRCEVAIDFDSPKNASNWSVIEIMYIDKSLVVGRIIETEVLTGMYSTGFEFNIYSFRPIKTEREQFIEQAEAMRESGDEYYDLLSRMHDSGARFK